MRLKERRELSERGSGSDSPFSSSSSVEREMMGRRFLAGGAGFFVALQLGSLC